jgi:glycerol-3-phosphate dehydrogenase (NAD(P)+)
MTDKLLNICFIGAGSIGTSLGNILSIKKNLKTTLFSIEEDVVESINYKNVNSKYFPNIILNPALKASIDPNTLKSADIIFLAIPSSVLVKYIFEIKDYINPKAILINLAKGFGINHKIITESLSGELPNPVCTLKGPAFARGIINKNPTALTFASQNKEFSDVVSDVFSGTNIYLDFSSDIRGVEIASILKNIYAIIIGIVDANFDSPNLRFLILTKAFKEMKTILMQFGGKRNTLFKYCGFGDFNLTALNDLSRNRTLGLLIGKGFFTADISDKVLLEGKVATIVFCEEISKTNSLKKFPLITELYKVFTEEYDVSQFVKHILK